MWWIVAAVVLGGTASAMQAPINAALARELGGTIPAVVVSFGVGFLVLLVVALVSLLAATRRVDLLLRK